MGALAKPDRALVRELRAQLDTYVDGGPHVSIGFIPAFGEAIGARTGMSYSVQFSSTGPAVAFHHAAGFAAAVAEVTRSVEDAITAQPHQFAPYDPARPQPDQRNQPLLLADLLEHVDAARPPTAYHLYRRFGVYDLDQIRVLVCDGPSLLAWVGWWRAQPFAERERDLLQALVPALRRRLVLERLLETDRLVGAALSAALEAIPRPAFVVTAGAGVRHANAAGLEILERHPRECIAALRASLRRAPDGPYEAFPIRAPGLAPRYLLVRRRLPDAGAAPVDDAARRWHLAPRQEAVLRLLVRGCPNQTIAALLGIAENTVEHHVSRLLGRAGVDSRAALLARVLRAT